MVILFIVRCGKIIHGWPDRPHPLVIAGLDPLVSGLNLYGRAAVKQKRGL
jgi:hypothetical protein